MAAQPEAPVRGFSFTDWQVAHPTEPPPGDHLDGEYDRTNSSVEDLIDWAATSLKTDGTIRDGVIGKAQLVSGLFDDVAQDIIDQVDDLVAEAEAASAQALASAASAAASATGAETHNSAAQAAAEDAQVSAGAADLARQDAQGSADIAGSRAADAANSANHASGDAALAEDWGIVSAAWAEHMPDTIPPNILAVMGVTGDHWSARWWAHKAAGAFGSLSELYLGVWPAPPTSTSTGDPIPVGAIYYNSVSQQPFVWTGTEWVPFYAPTKSLLLTLVYTATAGQTAFPLTTPDMAMNSFTINAAAPEPVDVYVNGLRKASDAATGGGVGNWTLNPATSTLTFESGLSAGDLVQIDVLASASSIAPSRVQTQALMDFDIDPATGNPGQIDGVRTTFPLRLAAPPYAPVSVASAQELFVSVDGVVQQPGSDYNVTGGNITLIEAPLVGARAWSAYYGPGTAGGSTGTAYLPITGGVLTGALTLDGSTPTLGAHAASKAYVDLQIGGGGTGPFLKLAGGTVTGAVSLNAAVNIGAGVITATNVGNLDIKAGATTSVIRLQNNNAANLLLVSGQATPVNRVSLTATNTGTGPSVAANGTDTNLDLRLLAQGTGIVNAVARMQSKALNMAPGTTDWTGSGGFSPSLSTLYSLQSVSGVSNNVTGPSYNYIAISPDTVDAGSTNGNGLQLVMQPSTGAGGGRQGIFVQMNQIGVTNTSFGPMVPFASIAELRFNSGGTATKRWAGVFGFNPYSRVLSGASYINHCMGGEINISVRDATGVWRKSGLQIVPDSADAYSGMSQDTYLTLGSQTGGIGMTDGIGLGTWTSGIVLKAAGETSIMRFYTPQNLAATASNMRAYDGINLSEASIERWAFRAPNFAVHGSNYVAGAVQVGNGLLIPVTGGVTLDSSGSVGTGTPTVAAGGANYSSGAILYAAGGVFRATVVAGVVTAVIPLKQPLVPSSAVPSNPVATTVAVFAEGGDGTGCTLNLAWTSGTAVNVGTVNATAINIGRAAASLAITGSAITFNGVALGQPNFQAYLATADQAVTANTPTKVQFQTVQFDAANYYDETTNYRYTPLVAGTYRVVVSVLCVATGGTSGGAVCAMIRKNGTEIKRCQTTLANANSYVITQLVTALVQMNGTTDYLEGWGQVPGTAGTAFRFGSSNTFIEAHYVGP